VHGGVCGGLCLALVCAVEQQHVPHVHGGLSHIASPRHPDALLSAEAFPRSAAIGTAEGPGRMVHASPVQRSK
jgi:hypothetical protein